MTLNTEKRMRMAAVIRALLSKTTEAGATEGEALAAAAKARELMDRYQIEAGALGLEEEGVVKTESADIRYGRMILSDYLSVPVAAYCDCKVWGSPGGGTIFFGLRSDTEFADWLMKSLTAHIERAAREFLAKAGPALSPRHAWDRRKSFAIGAVRSINARLKEATAERQAAQRQQAQASTGTSLMIVKGQLVAREFGKLGLHLRSKGSRIGGRDSGAMGAGMAAGAGASFGRPVGNGASPLAIGRR